MVDMQKKTFLESYLASEHISAGDVCVRQSVQDVSIMHKDPQMDVPAGSGTQVKAMALPKVPDPKSSLVNKLPTEDDEHTLVEEPDPTGITYGNQTKINTRPPMYGRTLVSAYHELSSFAEPVGEASFDERYYSFGGEGSGNFGHPGRPGEIGGSGDGGSSEKDKEATIKATVDKQMSMFRPADQTPEKRAEVEKFVRSKDKTLRERYEAKEEAPKPEVPKPEPKVESKPGTKDIGTLEKEYKTAVDSYKKDLEDFHKANPTELNKTDYEKWEKDKQKFISERYNKEGVHDRAQYHVEQANKLPIDQVRNELRGRYGESLDSLSENNSRQVYASITHNEEVLGKEKFQAIVKGFESKPRRGAAATYNYTTGIINIVPKTGTTNLEEWEGKDEYGLRFHPIGTGREPLKGLIDHEIGHGIHHNMASGQRKISRVTNEIGRDAVNRIVSGYATTNTDELAAECWSAHMNNGKANEVIEYVSGLMRG
jgi:hypothetical protein